MSYIKIMGEYEEPKSVECINFGNVNYKIKDTYARTEIENLEERISILEYSLKTINKILIDRLYERKKAETSSN